MIPVDDVRYARWRPTLGAVRRHAHALGDGTSLHAALQQLARLVAAGRGTDVGAAGYRPQAEYPTSEPKLQLQLAAQLVVVGFGTRLLHIGHGGFDTHARQLPTHAGRLSELDAVRFSGRSSRRRGCGPPGPRGGESRRA